MLEQRSAWLATIPFLKYADTLIAAAGGFLIAYLFTHHSGIGVSPDSIAYISAAHNLLRSGQLSDYTLQPLIDFPAGYPLILAGIQGLTHIDPVVFTGVLHPLMFAILICLCGFMADRMGYPSRWYKTVLLVCIALSPALIEVYIMLWSETLFIVLVTLFMIALRRYLYQHSLTVLLLVAFISALACTIRYAGVTLVATGGLLLLWEKYPSIVEKIRHIIWFSLVSISLLVINLVRNYHLSGTLTGMRQKGVTPLLKNIYYFGNTFSDWFFLFGASHYRLCVMLGLAILTLLLLLFTRTMGLVGLRRKEYMDALFGHYPALVRIALSFSLLYSVFMVLSATVSRYEQINSRLLSPLYIPLIFTLAYPLAQLTRRAIGMSRRGWKITGIACFLLVLSSQLVADYQWKLDISDDGIGGYTEDMWDDSPLVQFLKSHPSPFRPGYVLYSNSPEGVYFFGGYHCLLVPQKAFPGPIRAYYAEGRQYLIWFNDGDNDAILPQNEILAHKHMRLIQQFSDGAVFVTGDAVIEAP